MSLKQYLKERWLTYSFFFLIFIFSLAVYHLDQRFNMARSNATYLLAGWSLFFVIFVGLDYTILKMRVKQFKKYCHLKASSEEPEEFGYPMDQEYAALVHSLVVEYEGYKADVRTKSTEELDFITKWVHDVKVPISALRLILEDYEEAVPADYYQSIDRELISIEESIQQVFYELKTNNFHDDYKLAWVSSKKLIAQALKRYSSFFSYKKIQISLDGEAVEVLTDEKWSGYIMSQIISNAVKYTPMGASINIVTSCNDDETTITVRNQGKGILPKDLGQIFNKGYTASENRTGVKSTGYGLYLSKKLSDLLGHRLTVQSKYGEYAQFQLSFKAYQTLHQVTKM